MFYFCNNYVTRGQLFLLHNVLGTFSFPISLFLTDFPAHNIELVMRPREFRENHYNSSLSDIFPNSFTKERTQDSEMVGI